MLEFAPVPREIAGEFEQTVLLAILHLGSAAYGLSIADEIERRTGRRVARAAVYVALRRLEDKRLIRARVERGREAAGQPRRYVAVTPGGLALLRQSHRTMRRMREGLDALLNEV
jgi:DNA-binding PadR family transcriptional regulator